MLYNGGIKQKGGTEQMATFQERLLEAMELKEVNQAELVKRTGLSKPSVNQYVHGVYVPKQKALYKIAKALNVNISWLMGHDSDMNETNFETTQEELNACELFEQCYGKEAYKAVTLFLSLDSVDRVKIVERMETLLDNEKYSVKKGLKNA